MYFCFSNSGGIHTEHWLSIRSREGPAGVVWVMGGRPGKWSISVPLLGSQGQSMAVCFWLSSLVTYFHTFVTNFQNKWHCTIILEVEQIPWKQPYRIRKNLRATIIFFFLFYSLCLLTMLFLNTCPLWRASLVAQLVKNPPAIQETWDWSLGWENSPREGKGYPLQNSHLENSMDFIVHWVTKCQTRPNNFHWALYEKSSISKMHIQLQGTGSKLPLLIRPSLWDLGVKLDPWLCIFPVRVRKSSTECILNAYTIGRALCRRCRWRQEGF